MGLIVLESVIIAFSVLSIIPFADYLIDTDLNNPSKYTILLTNFLISINIEAGYLVFASIFVLSNLLRSFINLLIKYRVLKIKFSIQKSFANEILNKIFISKWTFFNSLSYGKIFITHRNRFYGLCFKIYWRCFFKFYKYFYIYCYFNIYRAKMTLIIIISCIFLDYFLILTKTSKKLEKKEAEISTTQTCGNYSISC